MLEGGRRHFQLSCFDRHRPWVVVGVSDPEPIELVGFV
jgi:hypothetical protein